MTSSGSNIAVCSNATFAWTFNSLNQSPCVVASYLGGECNSGLFNVPPLDNGSVYLGPTLLNTNACRCSSVFYSLIAGCSLCQNRDYLKWSSYNGNCTPPFTDWPRQIPAGTKVPHWAYLNVAVGDTFDPLTAQNAGDAPESSATAVASTSASGSLTTSARGQPTNATSPTNTSKSSSNTGAIAGGVVGGVVGLALVAALVFWLMRRRRNRLAPSSIVGADPSVPGTAPLIMGYNNTGNNTIATPYTYQHTGSTATGGAHPPNMPSPRLYDPSDPSTYPTTTTPPSAFTAQQDQQPLMQQHNTGYSGNYQPPAQQPQQPGRYTGAPEI